MEKTKNIIVADNQDITRVGMLYILADMQLKSISSVETKADEAKTIFYCYTGLYVV